MRLARRFSVALAIVSALTGVASFVFWGIFSRDVPAGIGNLRGTALALVALVLPVMVIAMRAAERGSLRGRLVWLACLAYVAYNAVMFCFASHFNALFLAFAAMLALSVWAIVTLVPTIDLAAVAAASRSMPARAISIYLFTCLLFFAGTWLATIVPATLSNAMPQALVDAGLTQNTVWVLDFGFTFPLMFVGARWLWQRKAWGYVIAGMMTVMLTLETAGVAVDQWFGHLHDASASVAAIPLMLGFTGAGLVFSMLFLRGVRPDGPGVPDRA